MKYFIYNSVIRQYVQSQRVPVLVSVKPPKQLWEDIADNSSSLSTTKADKPIGCRVASNLISSLVSLASKSMFPFSYYE